MRVTARGYREAISRLTNYRSFILPVEIGAGLKGAMQDAHNSAVRLSKLHERLRVLRGKPRERLRPIRF